MTTAPTKNESLPELLESPPSPNRIMTMSNQHRDVSAVLDSLALMAAKFCSNDMVKDAIKAREIVTELIAAASRAEVSFNSVGGCYEHNPRNFMSAMLQLEEDIVPLRAALKAAQGGE
jgi:DNA-binding transcriptional regulator LsrR (DeoR family)